jgi:hypothetical protein
MTKERISTSLAPEIIIEEVSGDLQFRGWDEPEVVLQAETEDLQVNEQDDVVRLNCKSGLEMRAPSGATVQLGQARGNARIRLLEDSLKIETVNGSLYLRDVAETSVDEVHGDLLARQVTSHLKASTVNGNMVARDVQGDCLIGDVAGNLDLRDVEGSIQVVAGGNARLRLTSLAGSEYEIEAGGNVHLRLPEDSSLQLKLSSGAQYILVKLPDGRQLHQEENYELALGDGGSVMNISAGGSIYLTVREQSRDEEDFGDFPSLPEDFGEQIARQVEAQIDAQMEMMNRQLNEQLAGFSATFTKSGMSPEEKERIMERARERSERAGAQAQEKMRRAQEKLERKLESARRREEARSQTWKSHSGRGGWHINFSPPPPPPPPTKETVSDEERLTILRMLEEKKITLEEAENLLSALEGQE